MPAEKDVMSSANTNKIYFTFNDGPAFFNNFDETYKCNCNIFEICKKYVSIVILNLN